MPDVSFPHSSGEGDPERAQRLWRRAEGVLAAGLWSLTRGTLHHPGGTFPLMGESGEGCYLVDTAGERYLDWMMGSGTSLLGYRHPAVEAAIIEQLRQSGPLLSLDHPVESLVANQVRELVPCAEAVAFGKNGSDVLGGAVRVARAATGRDGILFGSFHGFHDWYMASQPWCEGVPESLRYLVKQVAFNDLEGMRRLFAAHPDQIAAVVMEPVDDELPAPGYLEAVRELTLDHGALLIFDEVVTGFRLAPGGGQEAFGVVPDLACLGKTLANGMPLSALVGKREILEVLPRVGYGMTFRGEMLSLAASRCVLDIFKQERVAEHVSEVGTAVQDLFAAICAELELSARLAGPPARLQVSFDSAGGITPLGQLSIFIQECLKQGVLTNGRIYPCFAHGEREIEKTSAAFRHALTTVGAAVRAGSVRGFLDAPAISFYFDDDALEESEREASRPV